MTAQTRDNAYFEVLPDTKRDSVILMSLWYARKTFYTLLMIGLITASVTGSVMNSGINWRDVNQIIDSLRSPFAGIALAIIVRVVVEVLATLAAYPTVWRRNREHTIVYSSPFTRILDNYRAARGISKLRWTQGVRQKAVLTFETEFFRKAKPDRYIDWFNSLIFALLLISLGVLSAILS